MLKLRATAIGVAIAAAGCAGGDEPPPAATEAIRAEIFYAGIDGRPDDFARERAGALGAEITASPSDVVCLQGIFASADRRALIDAVGTTFPYSLELATDELVPVEDPTDAHGKVPPPVLDPPCPTSSERLALDALVWQAEHGCGLEDGRLASFDCLAVGSFLSADAEALSKVGDARRRCRHCFFTEARAGEPLEAIRERCENEPGDPLGAGGQHGMMILARRALSSPRLHVLPSTGLRRAIVSARMTANDGTAIEIACATLGPGGAAALPQDPEPATDPYPGGYGDPKSGWAIENALQVAQTLRFVSEDAGSLPVILLINAGASAAFERDGQHVVDASAQTSVKELAGAFPIEPLGDPACTACPENPLSPSPARTWMNRIFARGLTATATTRIYLGDVVAVTPGPASAFIGDHVPLSSQYGVRTGWLP